MNQFKYSNDNKRYHTFNYYLKNKYHCKVAKVGLNAGFTCPNRDGSKGVGGCIFCSDSGSGDFAGNVHDSLQTQFNQVSQILSNKWPGCKYIAYFQANTNTYGPIEKIKKCVEPFINKKDVVAISIATRPDCLNDDVLEYLKDVNSRCDLWVELGLQTIHDRTGLIINRCHSYQDFLDGLNKLRALNINVCVHIINGLPYETPEMMLETAKTVGQLDIQAIKIHMLYVIKNTVFKEFCKEFTKTDKKMSILSDTSFVISTLLGCAIISILARKLGGAARITLGILGGVGLGFTSEMISANTMVKKYEQLLKKHNAEEIKLEDKQKQLDAII